MLNLVSGIRCMSAGIQVIRIATSSVIASMADYHACIYVAIEKHESSPMRRACLGQSVDGVVPVPVSGAPATRLPLPAGRGSTYRYLATVILPRAKGAYNVVHQLNLVSWSRSGPARAPFHLNHNRLDSLYNFRPFGVLRNGSTTSAFIYG